ncbi:hypothetical protein V6N13_063348 [Hibiscus sabdariffa]
MDGAPPPLPYGNETLEICISFPPKVHSAGVWEDTASPSVILTYSLPLLELQMLLVFLITHLVHAIFKPLGITYFASQMFGGMILGMLGKVKGIRTVFFTADFGVETLETAAWFGFSMFMFLMGVKMDLNMAFKTSRRAILIGIMSLLSPMLVGLAVYQTFKEPHQPKIKSIEHLMGITIESLTSSSVITYLLSELKILNSELGRLALSASVVCDLSTLFLVYAISSTRRWSISPEIAVAHFIVMVGFVLVIFFVFRPLMFRIIRGTPDGRPVRDMYIVIIVMIAMGSSLFTAKFNKSPLIGPFLVGLAVPEGPPIGSALVDKFECFVNGIFLAIYVTTSAMKVHPRNLFADLTTLKFSLLNIVLSFLAKFLPCFVASFWRMMPFRDSLAFALIMTSKGVVELAYFSTFRDIKVNLNPYTMSRVMDRAPCSVGILITRGVLDQKRKSLKIPSRKSSSYSIGMLFLGGKDDREALTLAKRMARDPRVKLTVIHLTTDENRGNVMDWDMMLDAEILRDAKHNDVSDICNIMYTEEVSNSGPEATRIIQSIANEYDLIIVGRRDGVDSVQTKGLLEWSEFPELGVVGDLLASTDLDSSVSVLVVQQQHYVD